MHLQGLAMGGSQSSNQDDPQETQDVCGLVGDTCAKCSCYLSGSYMQGSRVPLLDRPTETVGLVPSSLIHV